MLAIQIIRGAYFYRKVIHKNSHINEKAIFITLNFSIYNYTC